MQVLKLTPAFQCGLWLKEEGSKKDCEGINICRRNRKLLLSIVFLIEK
jgi:hypothetical protein